MPLSKNQRKVIEDCLEAATFKRASFGEIHETEDFPKSEKEVTAWIVKRTEIYRDTWIIGRLQDLLDGKERGWL